MVCYKHYSFLIISVGSCCLCWVWCYVEGCRGVRVVSLCTCFGLVMICWKFEGIDYFLLGSGVIGLLGVRSTVSELVSG